MHRLEEVVSQCFRVSVDGEECFLKTVYSTNADSFQREFEILTKMAYHPNIVQLLGVTDSGSAKIDGLVLKPYVYGTVLVSVTSATAAQKEQWKEQLSDAVHFLHASDIVWGDAAFQNVMIDDVNSRVLLIDFGGGITRGWMDDTLYETKEGDLQALGRLHAFIDDLRLPL